MKKKNIFFIILVFLLISSIVSLNYFVDPYRLFYRKSQVLQVSNIPIEMLYLRMKAYKEYSSLPLVIGSSEVGTMFSHHCFQINHFNLVSLETMSYDYFSIILKNYLKINPETKRVVFFLSYMPLFELSGIQKAPAFTGTNYTPSELAKFLLSYDVTKTSVKILKKLYDKKKKPSPKTIVEEDCQVSYPKQMHSFHDKRDYDFLRKTNQKNLKNILEMVLFLKKEKIDCSIVIPPYNASFLALIDEFDFERDTVETLKRFLAENIPSDVKIYDMAFVNEYTSVNLLDKNDDMLYMNFNHPNEFFGVDAYKIFFDEKQADNSLYMLLKKDNINSVLKEQEERLEKYKNENRELIKFYNNVSVMISKRKERKLFAFKRKLFRDDYSSKFINNSLYLGSLCPKCGDEGCP